jgi:hypothetical protein
MAIFSQVFPDLGTSVDKFGKLSQVTLASHQARCDETGESPFF